MTSGRAEPPAVRFWSHVEKTDTCWLWTASRNPGGYGTFSLRPGKHAPAHRWAYEALVGPIPEGLELDHLCRVRHCVNPTHLEPVTPAVNRQRQGSAVTHCPRGHAYSPDNTNLQLNRCGGLSRRCRTCHRESERARQHANSQSTSGVPA